MRLATRVQGAGLRPARLRFARARPNIPGPVTFPGTPLGIRVMIALSADLTASWLTWNWYDITADIRWDDMLRIRRWRRDEDVTVPGDEMEATLGNSGGKYSRRNANSALFGLLGQITPIWVQVNPGSGFADRYHGYVYNMPKRWKRGGDPTVSIKCAGVMRLLATGKSQSAIERTMTGRTVTVSPIGQWLLEVGPKATALRDSVTKLDAVVTGVIPAAIPAAAGVGALLDLTGGASVRGRVATPAVSTEWSINWVTELEVTGDNAIPFDWVMRSGDVHRWYVQCYNDPDGFVNLIWETSDGATAVAAQVLATNIYDGEPHLISARGTTNGANTDVELVVDGVSSGVQSVALTTGPIDWWQSNPDRATTTGLLAVGYVHVYDTDTPPDYLDAVQGYVAEEAADRMARNCLETGIGFYTAAGETKTLGPQPPGTVLAVCRDAESVDLGTLYEREFGLAYKSSREHYNQPVTLALDQAEGELTDVVEVDDDDQAFTNVWTVRRPKGGVLTYPEELDPLVPESAIGPIDFNVELDRHLRHIAGWLEREGTVDEDRWTSFTINLAKDPHLIPSWLSLPISGRITVANPYAEATADPIDALAVGIEERINSMIWTGTPTTAPASLYRVGVYGPSSVVTRYDTLLSTTVAALAAAATTVTVTTADGGKPWDTSVTAVDVRMSGERITVGAIGNFVEDGFDRAESNGWGTSDSGQLWVVVSGTAADHSVAVSRAQHNMATRNLNYIDLVDTGLSDLGVIDIRLPIRPGVVATGADFRVAIEARSSNSSNDWARWDVEFRTSGVLAARHRRQIGGAQTNHAYVTLPFTYGAASVVWSRFRLVGDDMYGKVWLTNLADEPGGWSATQDDGAAGVPAGSQAGVRSFINSSNSNALPLLVEFDNFRMINPQTFSGLTRSVNGVAKDHLAGASVRLWETPYYAY